MEITDKDKVRVILQYVIQRHNICQSFIDIFDFHI